VYRRAVLRYIQLAGLGVLILSLMVVFSSGKELKAADRDIGHQIITYNHAANRTTLEGKQIQYSADTQAGTRF